MTGEYYLVQTWDRFDSKPMDKRGAETFKAAESLARELLGTQWVATEQGDRVTGPHKRENDPKGRETWTLHIVDSEHDEMDIYARITRLVHNL